MKRTITFLSICAVLLSSWASAQTPLSYYVDGSQTTNGTGTAASPWNRIWYAINRSPRDTTKDAIVYIKRGTYVIDSTDFLTQLYIGSANGGGGGKFLTLCPYTGDEGKVIIDGKKLGVTGFYPNMLVISGAKYVRLQNLVFRNLKNTLGYVVNVDGAQHVEIKNCAFDSLRWTTTSAEYGYPTVNFDTSHFIHAVYVHNSVTVTVATDTLRNSALGWGEFIRDAGGNSALTSSALVSSGNTGVASDYYVATTGNDTTGSGSISKPWRTIKKSLDLAGINYTYFPAKLIGAPVNIYLRSGTHKPTGGGLFIGSNRGANGQWLTIKNYPGESPIVDGSNITAKFSALFSISDAKYIRIQGLKLTKMTNDSALQYSDPTHTKDTRFGILVSGKSADIIIKQNKIYDMAWTRNIPKQKIPQPTDNLNPLVILGTSDTSLRNVIIDSNEVYNNVPGYSESVSINGNVDSFAVTNNEVHDNANIGIVAAGHYQWVVDNPDWSVTATNNYSKNGFIINNDVYKNISPVALSAGIYLDGSTNVTVEDNESYYNGVGISVGNEEPNSTSGGHLIQSNDFHDNLNAGMYYGTTDTSSMVQNCVAKWNTLYNNYILDSALRAKANNVYGITDTSQRSAELVVFRLQNSTFEENTIESLSRMVLGFYLTQSGLTFQYNEYYVSGEDACHASFLRDKNHDGIIDPAPADDSFTTFHQYAKVTGYDHTSSCEGQDYNPTGCGTAGLASKNELAGTTQAALGQEEALYKISAYPNPVEGTLSVRLGMLKEGPVRMELFDLSGRLLLSRQDRLPEGNHTIGWDNIRQGGIVTGMYMLKVTTPSEQKIIKLLVK